MDNVLLLPDPELIEKEAADWLARLDSDKALEQEEREALLEWLDRSPAHWQALDRLVAFWNNNSLTELMVPLVRHDSRRPRMLFSGRRGLVLGGALAAMFALVITTLSVVYLPQASFEQNGLYLTAVGQQKAVEMDDGSQIHLNTNSQVDVEYSEQYRNIHLLQGQAHFNVAKDPNRPFRVYAAGGRIQAVGTEFSVRIENAGFKVLVTEGRVALASTGGDDLNNTLVEGLEIDSFVSTQFEELTTLDAGESVYLETVNREYLSQRETFNTIETLDESELSKLESWRDGLLVFSGESLEQVVSEISRYTTVTIDIVDDDLRDIQIGGRFRVENIDNILSELEANFGIEVERLNYNQVQLRAIK